jgi:hypothetical protein
MEWVGVWWWNGMGERCEVCVRGVCARVCDGLEVSECVIATRSLSLPLLPFPVCQVKYGIRMVTQTYCTSDEFRGISHQDNREDVALVAR